MDNRYNFSDIVLYYGGIFYYVYVDMNSDYKQPVLVDNYVSYYISNILTECHNNRLKIYSIILNISILLFIIIVFGVALYYSYKRRLTPTQKYNKMIQDQKMVLDKIRFYQDTQKEKTYSLISNLPHRS
jgi:hypothetical protein